MERNISENINYLSSKSLIKIKSLIESSLDSEDSEKFKDKNYYSELINTFIVIINKKEINKDKDITKNDLDFWIRKNFIIIDKIFKVQKIFTYNINVNPTEASKAPYLEFINKYMKNVLPNILPNKINVYYFKRGDFIYIFMSYNVLEPRFRLLFHKIKNYLINKFDLKNIKIEKIMK